MEKQSETEMAQEADATSEAVFGAYFETMSPAVRARLRQIADEVTLRVTEAKRCISYRMPAFRLDRVFFYFAGFKQHIGVYPPAVGPDELLEALKQYRGPKGNLIFPHAEDLPLDLIGQAAEHMARKFGRR